MSRPSIPTNISNLKTIEEVVRFTSLISQEFNRVFSGNISFFDNIFVSRVDVTFSASNTDTVVMHGLQVVPTGYIVVRKGASITVYDGSRLGVDWTSSYIYLRGSATGTATVLVFA